MSKTIEELDIELCNAITSADFFVPKYEEGSNFRVIEGIARVLAAQEALTTAKLRRVPSNQTIQELENALAYARKDVQLDFRTDESQSRLELDRVCAAQEKLTAQKYEAIIEERVQETIKQRLEKPQPGDAVFVAWQEMQAFEDIKSRVTDILESCIEYLEEYEEDSEEVEGVRSDLERCQALLK